VRVVREIILSRRVRFVWWRIRQALGARALTGIGVRLGLIVAIVATIGCDRVTKHVAVTTLFEAPRQSFLADTFRLEYAENTGGFLSLGADWPPDVRTAVFEIGNGLLLVALGAIAVRWRWPMRALFGLALFVAGGASNLLDRIAYGAVIDFMNMGIGPVRTGIFNIADVAIMLGAALLILEGVQSRWQSRPFTTG
jgi:signal peptidase II